MIPRTKAICQTPSWQQELAAAITDPAQLWELLDLPREQLPGGLAAHRDFPLRVTHHYLSLIQRGDLQDPLLKQILPVDSECRESPGFLADPVGDLQAHKSPGLLHKYQGRALLMSARSCAINCRYCFRRHYPYSEASLRGDQLDETLEYLGTNPDIEELILSGGDPLVWSDQRLSALVQRLEQLPQLRRLRIHSRLPVALPSRLTARFYQAVEQSRLRTVLVLHVNHPGELAPELVDALKPAGRHGLTLLNQAVLLRGINDQVEILASLSEQLFNAGILPYYLHQLDPVQGAAHFAVPDEQAIELQRQLHRRLPGYLVPRLVREIPGNPGKTPLQGDLQAG